MRRVTFFVADLFHFCCQPFSISSPTRDLFVTDLLSPTFSIYVANLFQSLSQVFFCCSSSILTIPSVAEKYDLLLKGDTLLLLPIAI